MPCWLHPRQSTLYSAVSTVSTVRLQVHQYLLIFIHPLIVSPDSLIDIADADS